LKISAIIDSNVVSGTVLLDDLSPLTLKLVHRYVDSGVVKYLTINTVDCQPQKTFFDFAILNPYYVDHLYVDVNGVMQEVMTPRMEDQNITLNPINDYIYTQNQIPELREVEVLEVDPMIREYEQRFTLISHSPAPNLISMEDYSASSHFKYDELGGIRFTVSNNVVVASDVFELNHSSELTIAIKGDAPKEVRVVLINQSGKERIITVSDSYQLYGRTCFSVSIVSSTLEGRVEFDYNSESGSRNVRIEDIYVGKTAQYFEADDNTRVVNTKEITTHPTTGYVFDFDRLPNFGLRTLLDFRGSNGIKIQFSNSRVRVSKKVGGLVTQTIMSPVISNTEQIGVVVDDAGLKIYSSGAKVKDVQFQSPIEPGDYEVDIGASTEDPDYDSNTTLNLIIVNKNPFEG
jgi:hypothetical protein